MSHPVAAMHPRIKSGKMPLFNAVKCICSDKIWCFLNNNASCDLLIESVRMGCKGNSMFRDTGICMNLSLRTNDSNYLQMSQSLPIL